VSTPEEPRPPADGPAGAPAERELAERALADRILAERMLRALKSGADFRRRKVRRLRGAIRAFAYENPLKLQVALDRLSTDLRAGPDSSGPT
jgi:hypothetical protein